jgi:hypothetical protein
VINILLENIKIYVIDLHQMIFSLYIMMYEFDESMFFT